MKKYHMFLSENFPFLVVTFSVYLNRRVFVMITEFYSSSLEYMVARTPTLFKCSKIRVYTLLTENKLKIYRR